MNHESPEFGKEKDVHSISIEEFRQMAVRDPHGALLTARHALAVVRGLLDEMPHRFNDATSEEMKATRSEFERRATELSAFIELLEQ